ncbi:hypothetical protein GCM10009619_42680 [Williamsia maris]
MAVVDADPLSRWATEPRVKLFESLADKVRWQKARANDPYSYRAADRELQQRFHGQSYRALIAPISRCYPDWQPEKPLPEWASRHVVAHNAVAAIAHLTPGNALVAVVGCVDPA